MAYKYIIVKELPHGVVLIQLNRPSKLNALSKGLGTEISQELQRIDKLPDKYGCVVITGNAKAFCAGADIAELKNTQSEAAFTDIVQWSMDIAKVEVPIIAAVSGYCFGGGCELAMVCDMLYCTESAKFGQPEIKIGILPGAGGTQRLQRTVGKQVAMELILSGTPMSGKRAYELGLSSQIFRTYDEMLNGAIKLATQISTGPRFAARINKKAVYKGYEVGLSEGIKYEQHFSGILTQSEDKQEGMTAFLQKRKPQWAWMKAKL